MRSRLLRPVLVALAATVALVGMTLPASGAPDTNLASGGNPPGGWIVDPSIYESIFGGVGAGAPQGTVVADSGFRPYPHGFPLPNWGTARDFATNALVYGVPTRVTLDELNSDEYPAPAPLNSLALRRSLGDGVCRDARAINPRTGECDLILGAGLLAQMIESSGQGGHCFGLAAAAAALYNGQLPANQVGASGLGINAANPMGDRAIQTITRLFGAQYLVPDLLPTAIAGQSPTQLVETLKETLPSGTVPFILTLFGEVGGHGITPYAVLDRGNGLYDIAVYDNNFPFRALAVTVDTNTDSFVYTSAVNPNSPSYTWSTENGSTIALVELDDVLGQQQCPVCRGKDQGTMLAFSAKRSVNAEQIGIVMLDPQGQPLASDLYRVLDTLNPPTEDQQSTPLIIVDPGVEFLVGIQTGQLAVSQPMEVYALSNGASEYLLLEELPSNGLTLFGVGDGTTTFQSTEPSSPRIQQLYDGRTTSYDVNGHPLLLPKEVVAGQDWNRAAKQVRYSSNAKRTLAWNVQVTGVRDSGEAGWVALGVRVPAAAEILVDYSRASATTAPLAWVIAEDGSRTPVRMQPVTESLIEQYRDELYVVQGPS
jgi:hypothetical protein